MDDPRSIRPEETRQWLHNIAAKALREAHNEQRRKDFRETLERVRRVSNLSQLIKLKRNNLTIELKTKELPRFKPYITITRRMVESDEEQ
jgi:hypothetical protein